MAPMKNSHQAILLAALAAAPLNGQTSARLEVTSPLGRSFQSQPDDKAVVSAAGKALAEDPKNVKLFLKPSQAQASAWQGNEPRLACPRCPGVHPTNSDLPPSP